MPKAEVRQPVLDIELMIGNANDLQLAAAYERLTLDKKTTDSNFTATLYGRCIAAINIEMQRRISDK